jgi:hypothetical protein
LDSKLYQLIWIPLLTNYTHELMIAKQNTDNRHLKFWHWKKVRSKSEKVKNEKLLTLALKSFWLIYESSNFSKYFGVEVIPKEQSFNIATRDWECLTFDLAI